MVTMKRMIYTLPDDSARAVQASLHDWRVHDKVRRLWDGDASLWTGNDEGDWLGWLYVVPDSRSKTEQYRALQQEVRSAGFRHILLLGMGGSSLAADVMAKTLAPAAGSPEFHLLDSIVPAQIKAVEDQLDLARTLVIVSSKSGTTLESNLLLHYFTERVAEATGASRDEVGSRFVAVTDPGTPLHRLAEERRFRHIFFGIPSIGGRYSALSAFGLVPAALVGLDVDDFLRRAQEMVDACAPAVPVEENPGVVLGTILAVLAARGRDKVTVVTSPPIRSLGAWLEQLLAESTGKSGKGIIPIVGEPLGAPDDYGEDRVFISVGLELAPDPVQDAALDALARAGRPVLRLSVADPRDLGQEFFRWEMATAVAGSLLGINPFDQPDVEASKRQTRRLMEEYKQAGELPAERPLCEERRLRIFADDRTAGVLRPEAGGKPSLVGCLRALLSQRRPPEYVALVAFLEMNESHEQALTEMRRVIRDRTGAATIVGFGPRFLHSTGQLYKGGPPGGVFLYITADDTVDLPVPEHGYTFGIVAAAQARGDCQVMAERGRRVLRVHLPADTIGGLRTLRTALLEAMHGAAPQARQ